MRPRNLLAASLTMSFVTACVRQQTPELAPVPLARAIDAGEALRVRSAITGGPELVSGIARWVSGDSLGVSGTSDASQRALAASDIVELWVRRRPVGSSRRTLLATAVGGAIGLVGGYALGDRFNCRRHDVPVGVIDFACDTNFSDSRRSFSLLGLLAGAGAGGGTLLVIDRPRWDSVRLRTP